MEWRHATGAEDRETSPEEDRVVRDGDGGVDEPNKEVSRRAVEEVSSSESDEGDVEEMSTEDEEEIWMSVERDGFPREDMEVGEGRMDSPGKKTLTRRHECGLHHHTQAEICDGE